MYNKELELPVAPNFSLTGTLEAKRIQEWLCFHGHAVVIDGDIGPATKSAIAAFKSEYSLATMDSIITPRVLAELWKEIRAAAQYIPSGLSLASLTVDIALHHLAVHPIEIGGDNRGPWVRHYNRGIEAAWCQGFASSMVLQASAPVDSSSEFNLAFPLADENGVMSLYVPWVVNSARKAGRLTNDLSKVKAGCMFFVRTAEPIGHCHVGIVRTVDLKQGIITTIEGNANHAGSSNGYEVCSVTRRVVSLDFGLI